MEPKTVLVIEDSPDLSAQLQLRLKAAGYSVQIAEDGNAGLQKARDLMPDVILLDLMLPGMDGYRLCRLLKFDKEYEKIPVIILSARSLEQDQELATETGADAYLIKPVNWKQLYQTMEYLIQRAETVAETESAYRDAPSPEPAAPDDDSAQA